MIELLVTTALAGLLLTVLLQVVAVTGRDRARMEAGTESLTNHAGWRDRLERELTVDLDAAISLESKGNQLVIEGRGGWDRVTREHIHEPARVIYTLVLNNESDSPGGLLIRGQRDLLDLGQQTIENELMATGVMSFTFDEHNTPSDRPDPGSGFTSGGSGGIVVVFVDASEISVPLPAHLLDGGEASR